MHPDEKPVIQSVYHGHQESDKTNAEIILEPLTNEVLRDITRNESCSRAWRKAAVKFLIKRKYNYTPFFADVAEFLVELKEEQEAEKEVQAIVESAVEEPLSSLSELEEADG